MDKIDKSKSYIFNRYGFDTVEELNRETVGQVIFQIWKDRARGLITNQQYDDQIDEARKLKPYPDNYEELLRNEEQK